MPSPSPTPGIDHTVTSSGPHLWAHQDEVVAAATRALATGPRTTGVMACGLGKTRVGAEVASRIAANDRVLIVAPTIDLLGQILAEWSAYRGAAHLGRVVAVCSDPHALLDHDGRPLIPQPTLVTTDPQQLTDFTTGPGRVTVATTYQSLRTSAAAHADHGLPPWRIAIIDEAHHSAGAVGKSWGIVHDDVALPAELRFYMTATPVIIGDAAVSMDDRKIFGPICKIIPFSRGIELGMLADYRLIVAVAHSHEVRALAEEEALFFRVGQSAVPAAMLARQIAILRAARDHDIRNMITYHHRVADAELFARTLPAVASLLDPDKRPAGSVWASHVHGGQTGRERRAILDRLRTRQSGLRVVSNSRVLTEGVDVPDVDGVAFLDPRESVTDIIQGIGRTARTGGRTDKIASIIVPLILDDGDDPEEVLLGTKFAPVLRVAQALRATDDTLSARLDSARRTLGTDDTTRLDLDRHSDLEPSAPLPDWLSISGMPVPPTFARAISVRIVRSASSSWAEGIAAYAAYRKTHTDPEPPRGWTTPEGFHLSSWLNNQKTRHREGRMTHQDSAELEQLGITWNKHDLVWDRFIADLIAYRDKYGDLDVPQNFESPTGRALGVQVSTRRRTWDELSTERQAQLLELDFIRNLAEYRWNKHFAAWMEFRDEWGHPVVPRDHTTIEGFKLGSWRIEQLKKFKTGELAPDRAARIKENELHLTANELRERKLLQALKDYCQVEGRPEVHSTHVTADGLKLGDWLRHQRKKMRTNTISPELAQELTQLGVRAVLHEPPEPD
ncbi:Helicase associated domain protein [Actinacidiphila sp. bgisy144]|uniref:helicase associated domain-containing protein n=1 Tax=Actinacidiphila sp. bgisy144 TaxID=3413791 RepID=UPI003EBCFF0D